MTEVTPDWKPARRVKDPTAGTAKVRREARCRACGYVGSDLSRAHLVGKGVRGDDVDANIIPLCGGGNTGCHGAFDGQTEVATEPSLLRGRDRRFVASRIALHADEYEYCLDKKGLEWTSKRFSQNFHRFYA